MSPPEPPRSGTWWAEESEAHHRLPAAKGAGSRRAFGQTWWGRAWIDALEHRAALDPGRLSRGRSYARRGAVAQLQVASGLVMASVQGSRPIPYTVTVRIPTFSPDEWTRVLDAVGAQIGRVAALLDGELPPEVVSDVAAAGLELLPGPGEIRPACSCPDWGEPCKHAAAVCYLVADLLDADPFTALRLRGRSRTDVLEALRARRTTSAPDESGSALPATPPDAATVLARLAYAEPPLPRPDPPVPPLPPSHPGRPVTPPYDPPSESGIDPDALSELATAAARRAWRLATMDVANPTSTAPTSTAPDSTDSTAGTDTADAP
ncbi:SWIM zinc finger family protein [Actinopolymorpha pittospori]|uniref:Zn finger protein n=1 Tax=Actinopolymorpha pittospori TaxID=648752 RepID=A0A927MYB2_9ACTN|nr:SWIM zinc finger family protein [Actinopolymorpha pittospori]MBE1608756.1 putative Zn finger protein [Actinopolymorpha pittospori]